MNLSRQLLPVFALMVASTIVAFGEEAPAQPPTEAELRTVITKSLEYLARGSDAWMTERGCNACHHLPQVLWNHREAKKRGFAIDEKKFDEWLQWSYENGTDIKPGREMTAFLKLAMPDKPAPQLSKIILEGQKPDGSWMPAGQFLGQKRDKTESAGNSTRIFLLALMTDEKDKQASDAAMAKAAAFLTKETVSTSVETLAYRTLFARRLGKPEEVASLSAEILGHQHTDGGWGWQIKEPSSDAIATGLALYALQPSVDPAVGAAIVRAQKWLIASQKEDGGWFMDYSRLSSKDRSKPDKAKSLKDATQIYSYWGTAWSTLGLLQGVPEAR